MRTHKMLFWISTRSNMRTVTGKSHFAATIQIHSVSFAFVIFMLVTVAATRFHIHIRLPSHPQSQRTTAQVVGHIEWKIIAQHFRCCSCCRFVRWHFVWQTFRSAGLCIQWAICRISNGSPQAQNDSLAIGVEATSPTGTTRFQNNQTNWCDWFKRIGFPPFAPQSIRPFPTRSTQRTARPTISSFRSNRQRGNFLDFFEIRFGYLFRAIVVNVEIRIWKWLLGK